jgi:hypothetical protein
MADGNMTDMPRLMKFFKSNINELNPTRIVNGTDNIKVLGELRLRKPNQGLPVYPYVSA